MAGTFEGSSVLVRNASALAADLIREAIMDGRLSPGSRLKEGVLAAELGISRTPIREALQRLSTEGLVQARPNRGAFVRSFEPAELDELYELRALLEGHAARRAAVRLTELQLDDLRASCARFEALSADSAFEALVQENGRFHDQIYDAAGSQLLVEMIHQVVKLPLVYRSYVWYSPDQKRSSEQAHRELVAAFEQRAADQAEEIMRHHVLAARDVLIAHLAKVTAQVTE